MERIAVFPGSFDPITMGHVDIIERAVPLFNEIVIAIGINTSKKYHFSLEKRMQFLNRCFDHLDNVSVNAYKGLTVDYCRSEGAQFILRGLRSSADFEYEKKIAHVNKELAPDIESMFFLTHPQYAHISSSIVREILSHGGDPDAFLPPKIRDLV